MKRYTIDCTPEQTCKALELGAPIKHSYDRFEDADLSPICEKENKWLYAIIPTAEQMIGWLEDQSGIISVEFSNRELGWEYLITTLENEFGVRYFPSRKKATLAAIDMALEYLSNK